MQKRIFRDLLTYLPAKVLPALTAVITVPIFTRLFLPDEYGNYMLAFGVAEFLYAAGVTGLASSAMRFYASYEVKSDLSKYFSSMFASTGLMSLLAAVFAAIVLVVARSEIDSQLYPMLWVAIVLFVVESWFNILMQILRAQERGKWYTVFELFNRYGTVVISLIMVLLFSIGAIAILWGQIIAMLIPAILLLGMTRRGVPVKTSNVTMPDLRIMFMYALPLSMGNIAAWGLRLADRYIIKIFEGSYEVGLYGVSYNISARSIELLVGLFLLVPAPILFRLWEEKGREETEHAITIFSRVFFVMVIPAVVGLWVLAKPMVGILADEEYYEGYKAVGLVAAGTAAFGLSQLASYGTLVSNRTRAIAVNQFIAVIISLALNFLLVPHIGFMGAAWAAAISFVALSVLQARSSAQFLTLRLPWRSLANALAASAVMGFAVWAVAYTLNGYDRDATAVTRAIVIFGGAGVGVVVYGLVLWILGEFTPGKFRELLSGDASITEVLAPSD
ncbi:lipopolysaccharide biosynthesis protein [Aggregatilinea lenta]|uniref:lipopolysaccharide biosynthesis protein n=1 Tax=Aggregatilinea lenta TaxID=913108 RepID=UPI000E5B5901|nr:polysaccharide biosynthesis C-terminal domain-containing protein [Aggregatilinea lenta]